MLNLWYIAGGGLIRRIIDVPSNFDVEIRAKSPDNSRIDFQLSIGGEVVWIDDNPSEGWLYVGVGGQWPGEHLYRGSDKLTDLKEFQIYRIEFRSGNIKVYKNGELIGERFIEAFRQGGELEFRSPIFWNTNISFDYIKINEQY